MVYFHCDIGAALAVARSADIAVWPHCVIVADNKIERVGKLWVSSLRHLVLDNNPLTEFKLPLVEDDGKPIDALKELEHRAFLYYMLSR